MGDHLAEFRDALLVGGDLGFEVGDVLGDVADGVGVVGEELDQFGLAEARRRTRRKLSMRTPSSSTVVASGVIEPGAVPPTSAWWPREATRRGCSAQSVEHRRDHRDVRQVGAAVVGGVQGEDVAGCMSPALRRMIVSTERSIEPRCTGMCGALATSAPLRSKTAQEKSSRSLMLTE